jgi:hypothetical protein
MKIHKPALAPLGADGQGPKKNQEACPSNLEAECECRMKIHKPAQALLGAEGPGPMKIQEACLSTLEADSLRHIKSSQTGPDASGG